MHKLCKNDTIRHMKRIILLGLFLFCTLILCPAYAFDDISNKTVVESLCKFSFENEAQSVSLKVLKENQFENGIKLEEGSILTAKVTKAVDPKRGKRNGYLIIEPVSYTIPSTGETKNVDEPSWSAKVLGYKPLDAKKSAVGAGLAVAGHFVKGIGQFYYFGKGVISPEDGENRLKSGVKNVYENSPLVYLEEGEEAHVEKGDLLLLKFYYDDVPKWKFWQRNQ